MKVLKSRNRILIYGAILLLIVAGVGIPSSRRAILGPLGKTVHHAVAVPARQLQAVIASVQSLREMYFENTNLKVQMQNYNLLQAQLSDLEAENARLKTMIQFKNKLKTSWKLIPAQVIGRNPGGWNDELTIDVGNSDAVHPNMIVVSPNGNLVGRISNVTAHTATVVLITSTSNSDGVSAYIEDGKGQFSGIVYGSPQTTGVLNMEFISPLAKIKDGDTIITSGIGNIYPKGIVIGKVISNATGVQGLTQTAKVKPVAKLDYLQDVFVIAT